VQVAYFLTKVSDAAYLAGNRFMMLGSTISGIYLLGQYLATPFYFVGANIIGISINMSLASNAFVNFYNQVVGGAQTSGILDTLIYYANQLINFITNPLAYVANWVRQVFWWIDYIYYNTYEFIFAHVIRILDVYFPYWRDIGGWVYNWVSSWVYDWHTFRFDPVRWVTNLLSYYSGAIASFLRDPDGWVRERVRVFFPELQSFLFSPADYILEKLSDRLELFIERNLSRLVKAVENALSSLF
jgi:hypothetical protein